MADGVSQLGSDIKTHKCYKKYTDHYKERAKDFGGMLQNISYNIRSVCDDNISTTLITERLHGYIIEVNNIIDEIGIGVLSKMKELDGDDVVKVLCANVRKLCETIRIVGNLINDAELEISNKLAEYNQLVRDLNNVKTINSNNSNTNVNVNENANTLNVNSKKVTIN